MIDMQEMLSNGVHFGHRKRYWNPKMAPYIFGVRQDLHVIDLRITRDCFEKALKFIEKVISGRGTIAFVGTKGQAQEVLKKSAREMKMPYVNRRWLGGMLTNFKTIRQSVKRLKKLEEQIEKEQFSGLKKKEILTVHREHDKLETSLGGVKEMKNLPDALFVVDIIQEKIAICEAQKLGIPVIAIVDTNADPDGIDYVIPGNDDALRAIQYYLDVVKKTVLRAQEDLKPIEEEKVDKKPVIKVAKSKSESVKKAVENKASDSKDTTKAAPKKKVVTIQRKAAKTDVATDDAKKTSAAAKKAPTKKSTVASKAKTTSEKKAAAKSTSKSK